MRNLLTLVVSLGAIAVSASLLKPVAPPTVDHLDTEVSTNVFISSWLREAAEMQCRLKALQEPEFSRRNANLMILLDATDISVDGAEARALAYEQNFRLMFNVIKNYDPRMIEELLLFLKRHLDNVFELSFAAGAVKDRSLWSDVLWYKNLVDNTGLDYLVSIPVVKSAIQRNHDNLVVEPGKKYGGSTIHLPFGHLQYFHKQLEFFQKLNKIQQLVMS